MRAGLKQSEDSGAVTAFALGLVEGGVGDSEELLFASFGRHCCYPDAGGDGDGQVAHVDGSGRHRRADSLSALKRVDAVAARKNYQKFFAAIAAVSKPISREELQAAIMEQTGQLGRHDHRPDDLPGIKPAPPSKNSGWDPRKFMERIGNDESLLREVTDIFLDQAPKLMARLREAVASQSAEVLERTAHSIKGDLAYFGSSAADHARELERMGREHDLAEADRQLALLEAEVASLMAAVRRDVRGESAHAG